MEKYFIHIYIASMLAVIIIFGLLLVLKPGLTVPEAEPGQTELSSARLKADDAIEPGESDDTVPAAGTDEKAPLVNPDTIMVYETYYMGDGSSEITEEKPPFFLLSKPRDYFEKTLADWDIMEFGEEKVVLRKNQDGKGSQYYVISEHEGYVAVFYDNGINGGALKEITDTPIKTLRQEEQETIRKGIHIFGNEALIRALEDYTS